MTSPAVRSKGTSRGKLLRLVFLVMLVGACSDETLNFFFDIPPPTPEEIAEQERKKAEEAAAAEKAARTPEEEAGEALPTVGEGDERPAIESVLKWDAAKEMLPLDDFDEVDWMQALREGLIKPRADVYGRENPEDRLFKFNFFLSGPDPSADAYFPHASHTEWLTCESCHPAIFPRRGTEITMDDVFAGEFCGRCHGVVAFAVDDCARCHPKME